VVRGERGSLMQSSVMPRDVKEPRKDATLSETAAYPQFWRLFGPPSPDPRRVVELETRAEKLRATVSEIQV
jgi:hypothetical protein